VLAVGMERNRSGHSFVVQSKDRRSEQEIVDITEQEDPFVLLGKSCSECRSEDTSTYDDDIKGRSTLGSWHCCQGWNQGLVQARIGRLELCNGSGQQLKNDHRAKVPLRFQACVTMCWWAR